MSYDVDLGTCCACGSAESVVTIAMLPKRSPYGKGWGCVVCDLPCEGAAAMLCDQCADRGDALDHLQWFCKPEGESYMRGRAPIAELENAPTHEHDRSKHEGE